MDDQTNHISEAIQADATGTRMPKDDRARTHEPKPGTTGENPLIGGNRKARWAAKSKRGGTTTSLDYAALGVDDAIAGKIEKLRLDFFALGQRSTDQTFALGEIVAHVHELVPDQKTFEKVVRAVFKTSRRSAENLEGVFRNLSSQRERLVKVGMKASCMYSLAHADPERVEEVLKAAEGGTEMTGAVVKSMLGGEEAPSSPSPDDGGPAGLKALVAEKTAVVLADVMEDAERLLVQVLVQVGAHKQGKRLVLKEIQRSFIHPSRLLRERLRWLTLMAVPAPEGYAEGSIHQSPPSPNEKWRRLLLTLENLGGFESWPKAGEVPGWLADTVTPQLEWLLGDRAQRSHAAIEKMAAAAEAQSLQAEKAKARAKAEAKKSRVKGKREKAKAQAAGEPDVPLATKMSLVMSSIMAEAATSTADGSR